MINNTVQTNSETQWGSAMLNKECKLHIGKREKEGFSQQKWSGAGNREQN